MGCSWLAQPACLVQRLVVPRLLRGRARAALLLGGMAAARLAARVFDALVDLLERLVDVLHRGAPVAGVFGLGRPQVVLGELQLLLRGEHLVVPGRADRRRRSEE